MTEAEAEQELIKKLSSFEWRINNLYHIRDKNGKKVLLKINFAQRLLLKNIWFFNVILKARQLGFSTLITIYFLDSCLFNQNHKCGIIDSGIDDAKKKLAMIKFAFENIPAELNHPKIGLPKLVKDAAEVMSWDNGSSISVGTSHRGDTLQKLLISEYGKVSAATPEKAREIKTGALNAVGIGQQIFVESTAEGKMGEFYDLCKYAQNLKNSGKVLTQLEPKFHFFSWFDNPDYTLNSEDAAGVVIPQETEEYLSRFNLTAGQKAWYAVKEQIMGEDMRREYPATPDEAFEGSAEGAFYTKEMALVRRSGQITNLPYDRAFPVSTYWDLGKSRSMMSIIFYQKINNKHHIIDYHESHSAGWDFYASLLNSKGYVYEKHIFPHDGDTRIVGREITTNRQMAEQVGIRPIKIIPQTKSVWEDIRNYCKPTLPTIWFDESKASVLINHLDCYTRRWDRVNGMWLNDAQPNEASHGADSFRTLVMAINQEKKQVVADFIPPGYYATNSYDRRN